MAILKKVLPRVRYASRAAPGPPENAMNTTAPPTSRNRRIRPKVAMRAGILMKRADDWRAEPSGGRGGFPARALPAAEAGEHVGQRRQRVVRGGLLLIVDHQQSLGLEAQPGGDVPDRVLHVL